MADRPWRTPDGLLAVLMWSGFVGIPVLVFHSKSMTLGFGEHLHAGAMYLASVCLVFWLAARPGPPRSKPKTAKTVGPVRNPAAVGSQQDLVWEAQLVTPIVTPTGLGELASIDASDTTDRYECKLTLGNYLGSSRPRLFCVEPAGINITLLPGQDLEVTAISYGAPPAFRIVESDMATQVFVDGFRAVVSAKPLQGKLVS